MQTDTSETVVNELQAVVGTAPVQSAEDLVVALSQAVLLTLDFEFRDRPTVWASPGLPQGRHSAQFVYVSGNDESVNVDWVVAGSNVMMLVQKVAADEVRSVQLRVASLVSADAQFPLTVTNESIQAALTADAVETATAAIRKELIDTSEPEPEAPPHPRSRLAPSAQPLRPQQPPLSDGHPSPFDRPNLSGPRGGDVNPLSVGRDDLDPLGGAMRGGPLGGIDEGGGMFVGPNHPMFRQGGGSGLGSDPLRGPDTLPPGAVPPGARFDPITPLGPNPPGGLPRGGLPRGGGGAGPFSGEPDPDNAQPPNPSWNYYL